jgi:hypothetical protein
MNDTLKPWLIVGAMLLWVASLAGVGYWQNDAGHVAERSTWQGRENAELRTANSKIKTLEEGARKAEQDKAVALAAISTDYERKLSDANKQRAADTAAVRAGSLRLRDPSAPGLRACGSIPAETAAGTGQRDGESAGELSAAASEFLLSLVNEADDVARQLGACQQVVIEDRNTK